MSDPREPGTPPPNDPPQGPPTPPPSASAAPPPPPPSAAYDSGEAVSGDDKSLAMLTHLSGIVLGFIVSLVVWLMHKDKPEKAWLVDQAKEALNFQITVTIAAFVCGVLMVVFIGFLLLPLVLIGNLVLCILAGLKAKEGEDYRYPATLRLIS